MEQQDKELNRGRSTINHHRENNFVTVSHGIVNDDRLTWKAKGIMMYLLSRPDGWRFWESEIERHAKDGRTAIASGLLELEKYGYLVRTWLRENGNGKYMGRLWDIYEVPIEVAQTR